MSRKRQRSKIEKACAVQSELPSCANLEVEDTNCDPEHQDLQTLGVERLGSSPRRLQAGGAAQYCTALVSLHDRRIFRSGRPLWNSLFSPWKKVQKNAGHTPELGERRCASCPPDLKPTAQCLLLLILQNLKPSLSCVDSSPRKTINVLPRLLCSEFQLIRIHATIR